MIGADVDFNQFNMDSHFPLKNCLITEERISLLELYPDKTPGWGVGRMKVSKLPTPSTTPEAHGAPSLGRLDALPNELLTKMMSFLDFQSLCRVTQISSKGHALVQSMPEYRALMKHASDTLHALSKTKLISHHSAALLYLVLQTEKCALCGAFGRELFLPTCTRVCTICPRHDESLWMIPIDMAADCFDLSIQLIETLPVLHTTNKYSRQTYLYQSLLKPSQGPYGSTFSPAFVPDIEYGEHGPEASLRLVHAGEVKKLSLQVQRAENWDEYLKDRVGLLLDKNPDPNYRQYFEALIGVPTPPYNFGPTAKPEERKRSPDERGFMRDTFIGFPSLKRNGEIETGRCCYGCYWFHSAAAWTELCSSTLPDLDGWPHYDKYFQEKSTESWTKSEFPEHVKHCLGARVLLSCTCTNDLLWHEFLKFRDDMTVLEE